MQNKKRVIGLTGSIGSGKSTVSDLIASYGIPVIDADRISHEAVMKGSEGLCIIAEAFGREYISEDGSLDRRKLGALVFEDESARRKLNEIVHPIVIKRFNELKEKYEKEGHETVIFDCPLLLEEHLENLVDTVLLVYVKEEEQIRRIMERDKMSTDEALMRINSQMAQEEKKKLSDVIIDNSGSLENLRLQVENLIKNNFNKS